MSAVHVHEHAHARLAGGPEGVGDGEAAVAVDVAEGNRAPLLAVGGVGDLQRHARRIVAGFDDAGERDPCRPRAAQVRADGGQLRARARSAERDDRRDPDDGARAVLAGAHAKRRVGFQRRGGQLVGAVGFGARCAERCVAGRAGAVLTRFDRQFAFARARALRAGELAEDRHRFANADLGRAGFDARAAPIEAGARGRDDRCRGCRGGEGSFVLAFAGAGPGRLRACGPVAFGAPRGAFCFAGSAAGGSFLFARGAAFLRLRGALPSAFGAFLRASGAQRAAIGLAGSVRGGERSKAQREGGGAQYGRCGGELVNGCVHVTL